jgi:import inner membrane translocase subunit TIM8
MSNAAADKAPSRELQAFLEREQQLAQVQQMIATLTEVCFEKCVSSPGSYLSSRESSCIENCAKRFVDTTQFILQRAAHKAGEASGGGGGGLF